MKKRYTKRQILESIKYWEKQLNESLPKDDRIVKNGKLAQAKYVNAMKKSMANCPKIVFLPPEFAYYYDQLLKSYSRLDSVSDEHYYEYDLFSTDNIFKLLNLSTDCIYISDDCNKEWATTYIFYYKNGTWNIRNVSTEDFRYTKVSGRGDIEELLNKIKHFAHI